MKRVQIEAEYDQIQKTDLCTRSDQVDVVLTFNGQPANTVSVVNVR
jgi:hypothetical protein